MLELREVLSIPTFYGGEELIIKYIANFAERNGIDFYIDQRNNVYLTKGEIQPDESYPCVVAHMDTVHTDQEELVDSGQKILINEFVVSGKTRLKGINPIKSTPTGIGGDNKCGLYIALKLMLEFDVIKGAFFVEEETGMNGSKYADDTFFANVGYAIQFDAPSRNWFSEKLMGVKLWNKSFLEKVRPALDAFSVDNFTHDPYTDVLQMRTKYNMCCAVFPSGYYCQHTSNEYVIPEETEECFKLGVEAIKLLGNIRYSFK